MKYITIVGILIVSYGAPLLAADPCECGNGCYDCIHIHGFYGRISPASGVAIGTTSEDISLRLFDIGIGYEFNPFVAVELAVDYDYFLYVDSTASSDDLLNYSLNFILYPLDGVVRGYLYGGVGAYNFLRESTLSSKVESDVILQGGVGASYHVAKRHAIDLRIGPRLYNNLQHPTGVFDDAWVAVSAGLYYKYTFLQ